MPPGDCGALSCELSKEDRPTLRWAILALRLGVVSRCTTPAGDGVSAPNEGLGIMGTTHINAHTTVWCSVYACTD